MAVNIDVARALANTYSEVELRSVLKDATDAVLGQLPGVRITSTSFKDQSSAGVFKDYDPQELVCLLNAALEIQSGAAPAGNPHMVHQDFSCRPVGW